MKIDETHQNIGVMGNSNEASVNRKNENISKEPGDAEKAPKSGNTQIDISSTSFEHSRAARAVAAAPDERAELISDLKQRIENGTYDVKSEKVADKILNEELSDFMNS